MQFPLFIQNNFVYLNMSNKQKQLGIMKSQKATNAENRILKAENIRQAKEILELKEKLWNTSNERNELKQINKSEKMESLENLQNLLGQNAEMVISENGFELRVVRVCIMGDQETQHNNNQVLRALGSSTNELRRLCRLSSVQILELMHDDGTLHLTISEESAQRLELEITDTL